jgi:hypothetical protein
LRLRFGERRLGATELTLQLKQKPRKISNAQIRSVAGALNTIAGFVGGENYEANLKVASEICKAIMVNHQNNALRNSSNRGLVEIEAISILRNIRQAAGSYPTNSYTNAPQTTSTSKNVTPPDASKDESREQYIQRLVDNGFSSAAAIAAANDVFGPTAASKGGTYRFERNSQGGYKSQHVLTIPKAGPIKQARVADVAPWAITSAGVDPDAKIVLDSGIRSASQVPAHFIPESIEEIFARKAESRTRQKEASSRIMNAKKQSEIPSWAIVSGGLDE